MISDMWLLAWIDRRKTRYVNSRVNWEKKGILGKVGEYDIKIGELDAIAKEIRRAGKY